MLSSTPSITPHPSTPFPSNSLVNAFAVSPSLTMSLEEFNNAKIVLENSHVPLMDTVNANLSDNVANNTTPAEETLHQAAFSRGIKGVTVNFFVRSLHFFLRKY